MATNTGKLAGRTLFITGASRGIGRAIALKAAKDGANIAIAAKTTQPHPKLPGTIYTAAKEIEEAGGKALACVVDIQSEEQVSKAVDDTVRKFGGIDILVNNASAIHLTGTTATPMKRYDLMHGINTRGTFLCSQKCAPHLKVGQNPHILNLSPPLNMKPRWFKDHVAYTMAKYGMSMCALGMAEEFREDGIAVNTLWPRTAIWTAAMAMLGGDAIQSQCRTDSIVADAAYTILTKDSRSFTGNFCIDDEVLSEAGLKDFDQYKCVPDGTLMPDFFLDALDVENLKDNMAAKGVKLKDFSDTPSSGGNVQETFKAIKGHLGEDLVKSVGGVFQFHLTGSESGTWYVDMKSGGGAVGEGEAPSGANCIMTVDCTDFVNMFKGKLKPTAAFMGGKLKIKGDLGMAMKLEQLMGQMLKSKL